jgi:hypothetical protein
MYLPFGTHTRGKVFRKFLSHNICDAGLEFMFGEFDPAPLPDIGFE